MKAKKVKPVKKPQMSLQEYLHKLFSIPVMGGRDFIPLREVTHLDLNNKLLIINMCDLSTLSIDRTMISLNELMPEPHFIMTHAGYIVNLHYVRKHRPGKDGIGLKLSTGKIIPISDIHQQAVKEALDDFSLHILPRPNKI